MLGFVSKPVKYPEGKCLCLISTGILQYNAWRFWGVSNMKVNHGLCEKCCHYSAYAGWINLPHEKQMLKHFLIL